MKVDIGEKHLKNLDYCDMCYFKSLLATDSYENIIKFYKDISNNVELIDLFHQIDLMHNQLQII